MATGKFLDDAGISASTIPAADATADFMLSHDGSASAVVKIPMGDLQKRVLSSGDISYLSALANLAAVDSAADKFLIWDNSASALKTLTATEILDRILTTADISSLSALTTAEGVDTANDAFLLWDNSASAFVALTASQVIAKLWQGPKVAITTTPQSPAASASGTLYHNTGSSVAITVNLPAATVGTRFSFARVAAYDITLDGNSSETINGALTYTITNAGRVDIECFVAGQWIVTNAARLSDGKIRFSDYGPIADDSSDNATQFAAMLSALNTNGGYAELTPAILPYRINSSVSISDRRGLVLEGFGQGRRDATNNVGYGACFKVGSGWGATTAMFRIIGTSGATQEAKGGLSFRGMSIIAGLSGIGSGGYAFEVYKSSASSDFWGDLVWEAGWIINANIGVYFNDSGNGFGWISFGRRQRIEACNYGIKSNCTTNDFTLHDCVVRWCKQAANNSYLTRSGGAVVLAYGSKINITGNDFEGSQVGVQLGGVRNAEICNNYLETMYDCGFSLNDCTDVRIVNNYCASDQRTRHIYVRDSLRVTQEQNSNSFVVCDVNVKDLVTDTPELTRFTVKANGSQTLEDFGFWMHSYPMKQKAIKPASDSYYPVQSISLSNAALEAVTTKAWDGSIGKALQVNPSANYGSLSINWLSSDVTLVAGQFVVISVRIFAPSANASGDQLYFEVYENVNGAGSTNVYSGTVIENRLAVGERILLQWVHKCLPGETTYRANLRVGVPSASNNLQVEGVSLNVVPTPAIDPAFGVISAESDASEFQYYRKACEGRYVGAAKPTGSLITWNDGEEIQLTDAVSASSPGYVVTVSGTGGGTAKFAAIAALGAEAT